MVTAADRLREKAKETAQWIADFREGQFNVACRACGVGVPYLPPEFFGLLADAELSVVLLDLLADAWEWISEEINACDECDCEDCTSARSLLARIEKLA